MAALDLQKIIVSREQNPDFGEMSLKKLSLKVTTWMKLYQNLETPEFRAKMRDVSISFANAFYEGRVKVSEHGTFDTKFISSAPYHYFLTSAGEVESTSDEPYSVAFHEIIDYTTGEIVDSLHINFMVEMLWITTEYMLAAQDPKMTVLYGLWLDPHIKYDIPFDIEMVQVETGDYGCHHSKISIFKYIDNKIRIIISSANMYTSDWQLRTQGIWISPFLPLLPETAEDTDGESPTNFKQDFLKYLSQYKNPEVLGWQALIHRTDCSAINVFFIASVPGNFDGPEVYEWGHKRLGAVLAAHATLPEDAQKWPVICQSSAVGVYGENIQSWILSHIVEPMSREKNKKIIFLPEFKFIYPTKKNYSTSYDAKFGSTPLMYPETTYLKQKWLKDYSYQWKADHINRTKALPHTKSYTRISPDETEISWFILTSSNVSKGAWGRMKKYGNIQYISNYEAGVVFIPQYMINRSTFPIKSSTSSDAPVFLLPYDLPLTKYGEDDEPFVISLPPEVPKAVTQAIAVEEELPTREDQLPVSAGQLSVSQDQLPVSADQLSVSQDQLPVSADQLSVSQDQLLVSADQLSISADQLLASEDQSPTIEDQLSTSADLLLHTYKEFDDKVPRTKFEIFQEWKNKQILNKIQQATDVEIITNEPDQKENDEENEASDEDPLYEDQLYEDYGDEENKQ